MKNAHQLFVSSILAGIITATGCFFRYAMSSSSVGKRTHLEKPIGTCDKIHYETADSQPKELYKEYRTYVKVYSIEDNPGTKWIRLKSKCKDDDKHGVTVDARMEFHVQRYNSCKEELEHSISLLVSVEMPELCNNIQFLCSAWPNRHLHIHKVVFVRRDGITKVPFLGPDYINIAYENRLKLVELLDDRGLNIEFDVFLHEYMRNKEKTELIRWMEKIKSFVEN
ncbi:hypothetical protein AQUCO_00700491v1 [Aquilegia coerulea]|uniref:Uncharacterized protein n=1 Tax=Aquilegia coerulea TaxID=218851 RepID=A0A2G5EKE4_AQUCA|nr:hypothetical protein AQUCO_00700491v1 [Aquilegia coerulea]